MAVIVALVSKKGGVGKSTLARGLAISCVRHGLVTTLADLDPEQRTATNWQRLRERNGATPSVTVKAFGNVDAAIAHEQDAEGGDDPLGRHGTHPQEERPEQEQCRREEDPPPEHRLEEVAPQGHAGGRVGGEKREQRHEGEDDEDERADLADDAAADADPGVRGPSGPLLAPRAGLCLGHPRFQTSSTMGRTIGRRWVFSYRKRLRTSWIFAFR